jgi:hypothetical protein
VIGTLWAPKRKNANCFAFFHTWVSRSDVLRFAKPRDGVAEIPSDGEEVSVTPKITNAMQSIVRQKIRKSFCGFFVALPFYSYFKKRLRKSPSFAKMLA